MFEQTIPDDCVSVAEAGRWASERLKREVTPANIAYLIQYGRVQKYEKEGAPAVSKQELLEYYRSFLGQSRAGLERPPRRRHQLEALL